STPSIADNFWRGPRRAVGFEPGREFALHFIAHTPSSAGKCNPFTEIEMKTELATMHRAFAAWMGCWPGAARCAFPISRPAGREVVKAGAWSYGEDAHAARRRKRRVRGRHNYRWAAADEGRSQRRTVDHKLERARCGAPSRFRGAKSRVTIVGFVEEPNLEI